MDSISIVELDQTLKLSGGGHSVRRNLTDFAALNPDLLSIDGDSRGIRLITRNLVPTPLLLSGRYVYMPQNATGWVASPTHSRAESLRRFLMQLASRLGQYRAKATIRIGTAIPGPDSSFLLSNVLDSEFETALRIGTVGLNTKKRHWVVISGDQGYKNLDLLLTASPHFSSSTTVVVRGALSQRRVELLEGSGQISVDPRPASRPEVLRLMSEAKGVIFPSLVEASPVTVLEAVAVGKRVVCSDIPGHRDLVGSVEQGVEFVGRHDSLGMAQALNAPSQSLSSELEIRSQIGRMAIRSRWNRALVEILETVLSDQPHPD